MFLYKARYDDLDIPFLYKGRQINSVELIFWGLIKKHMVSISKNIDLMNKTLLYTIYHKKYSMFNNNLNLFYFLQILHKK